MKTFRQMAFGATVSSSLPLGLLDNASAFSPAQAMIDLDVNRAHYKFAQGIEVTDQTLCVDLINELEFCESTTYLEHEHTFRHFRDVLWDTRFFDRMYREEETIKCSQVDEAIVKKADQAWRDIVKEQGPVELDANLAREIDRIVEAAKEELLSEA